MKFGVLGKSLPHSYSPRIHKEFADYDYTILERNEEEVKAIFEGKEKLDGFNVTIPYKKLAKELCSELSPEAEEIGAVNTVIALKDGTFKGFNTDVYGFVYMLRHAEIEVKGKHCLILGTGGASAAVKYALGQLGAASINHCSRTGEINYGNVYAVAKASEIIVNTTPVGMYPDVDINPIDLSEFPKLYAAADVIYNPSRTRFLEQAEKLGVRHAGGLIMLVAQAYKACIVFRGGDFSLESTGDKENQLIEKVTQLLEAEMRNITLVGMPGSGKSTIGKRISEALNRNLIDLDDEFFNEYGQKPADIISNKGEAVFREMETDLAKKILPKSGLVISTGGGIVTKKENFFYLRTNSKVIYIKRPLETLKKQNVSNRPLSSSIGVEKLYEQRAKLYEAVSDEIWNLPDYTAGDALISSFIKNLKEK
ncbi:MAG: hypothetical protein K5930_11225 [Treponemataceae bacterium]|nr:hypothetical protein [Treponemataceae bacterium]